MKNSEVIKITNSDIKVGDVTIECRSDDKLLKSLLNLEKGKIVIDKESKKDGLIGEYLSDFIYLPDAILHHDRIVLPRTKEYYVKKIGEEMLDSDVIKKLEKNNILYFPSKEAYDFEEVERCHRELTNFINNDHRVHLLALLAAPFSERASSWLKTQGVIDEKDSYEKYYRGGADHTVELINSVNAEKLFAAIPGNIADDPILSNRDTESSPGYCVFLTSHISVIEAGYYSQDFMFFDDIVREKERQGHDLITKELQRWLDKSTKSALSKVLKKLSETKESIERNLIEREWITEKQTYKIPFTFGLLINEMNRKSDPTDLIDVVIKKRKEKGNKAFRTLLRETDNEMRSVDPNRLKLNEMEENLKQVTEEIQKDSASKIFNAKTVNYLSNLGNFFYKIAIQRDLLGSIDVIKNSFELYRNKNFPYRAYMQKLGTADIGVLDKLEADRVFGKQGEDFASILRYYSAVGKKADEILKMKKNRVYL
jgi:hypothetical protein